MACEEVQRNTLVSLFAFCERVMFFFHCCNQKVDGFDEH